MPIKNKIVAELNGVTDGLTKKELSFQFAATYISWHLSLPKHTLHKYFPTF
jgi:hypothetical protein